LASVLGEDDGGESAQESAEGAAGFDLGELMVVADEDDFGIRGAGVIEEPSEPAGVDHAGFVEDEHGARWESLVSTIECREERVEGHAGNTGMCLQFGGGASGESDAEEVMTARFPSSTGAFEAGGLAGTGDPEDDVDAVPGAGQLAHHAPLFDGESGSRDELGIDDGWTDHCDPGAESLLRAGDEPALEAKHLQGRVHALRETHDVLTNQESIGAGLDLDDGRSLVCAFRDGAEDVAVPERR